jgi:hypothetical protein
VTAILFAIWVVSFFWCFRVLQGLFNPKREDFGQEVLNLIVASLPIFNVLITWMLYRVNDSEDIGE